MLSRETDTDRGVSPVIAVILMVAITVILSAVIGTFVLDIGSSLSESPPQASFEYEQNEVTICDDRTSPCKPFRMVNITHAGGEAIQTSDLSVTVEGERALLIAKDEDMYPNGWQDKNNGQVKMVPSDHPDMIGDEFTAGETVYITIATDWMSDAGGEWGTTDFMKIQNFGGSDLIYNPRINGNWHYASYGSAGFRLESGEMVHITYESPDGTSQILSEYEVK